MIRPVVRTRPVNRQEIDRRTLEAAGRLAEREARQMAIEMRLELRQMLEEDFERRPVNRRKAGTTHLHNAFRVRVESGNEPGGFPYRVVISTKPNLTDDDIAKIRSLMDGSRQNYRIKPRDSSKRLSWTNPGGGRTVIGSPGDGVIHPGQPTGKNTLRRARNRVVARRRRGNV